MRPHADSIRLPCAHDVSNPNSAPTVALERYTFSYSRHETVALTRSRDQYGYDVLRVAAIVAGLEVDVTGRWHFHEGFNCDTGPQ